MSAPELRLEDLTPFAQGYVEALLASLRVGDWSGSLMGPNGGVRLALDFSDLAPEARAQIIADCASFENIAAGLDQKTGAVEGRRFWNGRQSGLSGAFGAAFPPQTLHLGDDGKVRFARAGGGAE